MSAPRILAVVILAVAIFAAFYGVGKAGDDPAPAPVGSPASRLPAGLEPSATEHLGAASPLPSLATVRQRRGRRAASAPRPVPARRRTVVRRRPAAPRAPSRPVPRAPAPVSRPAPAPPPPPPSPSETFDDSG